MDFQKNVSLSTYNTFGIDAKADHLVEVASVAEVKEALEWQRAHRQKLFVLGGGSNVLFTKDVEGLVVKNDIKGIQEIEIGEEVVNVKAGAGECWHDLVKYCVNNGLGGIENLSLIPGNVGASPMQNIGAYGVEIKDVFVELEAMNVHTGELCVFNKDDCAFGYRESVFKNKEKGNYIITSVTYCLNKQPKLNTSYGAIEQELDRMGREPSIKSISDAVINIRRSKLPDPNELGNAGSFFKNPVIPNELYLQLKDMYPELVAYEVGNDSMKLAAGWLIEKCGLKGERVGNVGVHAKQALVLVNYGGASGREVFDLSEKVIDTVFNKFKVKLEREVNVI